MAVIIDGFEIDAANSEEPRFSSEVTEFPVEQGIGTTDHVRNLPIEITIEGVVTDTPVGPIANTRSFIDLPSDEFFAKLQEIHDNRQPIVVETERRIYRSMVLQDLSLPKDSSTGDSLVFRATFKEITLVTNNRIEINVDIPRARRKKNLGAKNPIPTPELIPFVAAPGVNLASPELAPGGPLA